MSLPRKIVIPLCLLAFSMVCCLPTLRAQTANCVDCDKAIAQQGGHGPKSSTDGRRKINVAINSSWGGATNQTVWNSVCAGAEGTGCAGMSGPSAIGMWNAVGSPYFLELHQDTQNNSPDIVITRVEDSKWDYKAQGCAETALASAGSWFGGSTATIRLPAAAANWSQATLSCILAHEMGHVFGLDHPTPGCANSIMYAPKVQSQADCQNCNKGISQEDVARSNEFAANPNNCKHDSAHTAQIIVSGFQDPQPFRYTPTCYYYWSAVDVYYCAWISVTDGTCHPDTPPQYIGTIYILEDVFCF